MSDVDGVTIERSGGDTHRIARKPREGGATPEEQLAKVREQLKSKTTEADQNAAAAAAATKRANDAGAALAATTEASIANQEAAITQAIGSANAQIEQARAAKRAARQSGDEDAEFKADESLVEAKTNLKIAEIHKTNFDQAKPGMLEAAKEAAKPAAVAQGPNELSRKWMAARPRFDNTVDPEYHAEAIAAHKLAVVDGYQGGTQAYLDYIDGRLAARFGKDHAKEPGSTMSDRDPPRRDDAASTAAPVGRDTERGYRSSAFGDLRLVPDGKGGERLSGNIPADLVEKAAWAGFSDADPDKNNAKVIEYVKDLLVIERDAAAGRGFMQTDGGSAVYR